MSTKIAIIGAGGLAKEYIEVAELNGYGVVGIFTSSGNVDGYSPLGYLDELVQMKNEFDGVAIAIGVHNHERIEARQKIIDFLVANDIPQINLISPSAIIHHSVKMGVGIYIHHEVMVSIDTIIGDNVIINTRAAIGHDCIIGNNTSIGPQTFIGGNTQIGNNVMIGACACFRDGLKIGDDSVVGIGCVMMRNLKPRYMTVYGINKPLRIVNSN